MEFLRANDQADAFLFKKFLAAALRHATHVAEESLRTALLRFVRDFPHFADGFLLGSIADAARVQQHDICAGLGLREGIALRDELGGDRFGIALVHLAAVGFYVNTEHREGW